MASSQHQRPREDLGSLLDAVLAARAELDRVRSHSLGPTSGARLAQHELVRALEAYTAELTACRVPVPYKLRDELRLYRDVDRLP